jgi:hypothetical protein
MDIQVNGTQYGLAVKRLGNTLEPNQNLIIHSASKLLFDRNIENNNIVAET